jgi:glycosyltransferase involved in cell wall biosynthesis
VRKLSIITVVDRNLKGLIEIYNQIETTLSTEIEWVIKDSSRCDATRRWGESVSSSNLRFISSTDSGIYEALNQAISNSTGEFYVTLGADDSLFSKSLSLFLEDYNKLSFFDILVFPVIVNKKVHFVSKYCPTFLSAASLVSSHSVGTFIKKSIHQKIGLYDQSYKILADSLFLTKAFKSNFKFCYIKSEPIGEFGIEGISSTNFQTRFYEAYRYQLELGSPAPLQIILFALRVFKHSPYFIYRCLNNFRL